VWRSAAARYRPRRTLPDPRAAATSPHSRHRSGAGVPGASAALIVPLPSGSSNRPSPAPGSACATDCSRSSAGADSSAGAARSRSSRRSRSFPAPAHPRTLCMRQCGTAAAPPCRLSSTRPLWLPAARPARAAAPGASGLQICRKREPSNGTPVIDGLVEQHRFGNQPLQPFRSASGTLAHPQWHEAHGSTGLLQMALPCVRIKRAVRPAWRRR
jgi:hypothetical protein